ncbi:MAG: phospholipid carrier-dependent glycosyltransferase [Deltaproteobacteria bacterium]|nr:phospholipid carrier-dependent glycosyltransferase [Deltaproteobacteria bacterium]
MRVLRRTLSEHGPLLAACFGLIALGIALRAFGLAHPPEMTFDEDHFVNNARNYIGGLRDNNDHPPLGKLLMAVAIKVMGDSSLGWRTAPYLFGLGNIGLGFLLGRKLFGTLVAGLIAATLIATDGFFICYSRCALLDGMLVFFMLASALCFVRADRVWKLSLGAFLAGCAATVKFSGVVMVIPLLLTCWTQRKHLPWWSLLTTVTFPAAYFLCYGTGLYVSGRPYGPRGVVDASLDLLRQHAGANTKAHPASSLWYTWFVPMEPITFRYIKITDDRIRGLTTLGNPLLWWTTLLSLIATGVTGVQWLWTWIRKHPMDEGRKKHTGARLWLALLWLMPMVPWMFTRRDSYMYHYLPCYGFGLVLLGSTVADLYQRRRAWVIGGFAVLVLVAAFYGPVAGQLEVTHIGWRHRLFLPVWD